MSNKNRTSLAGTIANLLISAPSTVDPEDAEATDSTSALLVGLQGSSDDVYDKEEELLGAFRKQNVDFLEDVDSKYAGKQSSRRDFRESDESSEDRQSDRNSQTSDSDDAEQESVQGSESDEYEDGNESDESADGMEEEENNEGSDGDNEDGDMFANDNDSYKHIKDTDVSARVKKGLCVRNQLSIWESLLEIRIQLQKSVVAANKMPNTENYIAIKNDAGSQFTNKVKETRSSLETVLDKLLLLQQLMLKRYPETKKLNKKEEKEEVDDGDEEIPSDTDVSEQSEVDEEEVKETPCKKRKLKDYENDIDNMHKTYKNYRNEVIQKWHDKTRIAVTKSNVGPHSIISHIEHTLNDRDKLLRRTQLKRGDYKIIGEEQEESDKPTEPGSTEQNTQDQYNNEIFDDSDYYHQLLRELIEVKSSDLTNPAQLATQWIQLQNLRSKMKRKIDTRATKGRKIRYAVHNKLVNFMAPMEENTWTDEAKTELYSSLFGKNK